MMRTVFFISGAEIAFILFILLMVFGADKIPEIARFLGKTMKSFRNATDEIKYEITKQANVDDIKVDLKKDLEETKSQLNQHKGKIEQSANKAKEEFKNLTGPIKRRF
ncbi:twin-arginine translocase TatA/TatE family subunit [Psychroflexus sp. ALD_RP9]|uniref:Sec-independent protein translocase subunit TatA/TatB n=1 Tax=Psychroflexus sp. ALD_RP9 TaxID=2777186 RepID=UPI001A8DA5CD|nr:twin-arginine translocase TatA/TatE family subunit [Psychroflexus sp. ALD_RP9]QSS97554.1 twin-arginine translocase TatA/TatE family subunit [Psychroflexus sp. ALD_RP9]